MSARVEKGCDLPTLIRQMMTTKISWARRSPDTFIAPSTSCTFFRIASLDPNAPSYKESHKPGFSRPNRGPLGHYYCWAILHGEAQFTASSVLHLPNNGDVLCSCSSISILKTLIKVRPYVHGLTFPAVHATLRRPPPYVSNSTAEVRSEADAPVLSWRPIVSSTVASQRAEDSSVKIRGLLAPTWRPPQGLLVCCVLAEPRPHRCARVIEKTSVEVARIIISQITIMDPVPLSGSRNIRTRLTLPGSGFTSSTLDFTYVGLGYSSVERRFDDRLQITSNWLTNTTIYALYRGPQRQTTLSEVTGNGGDHGMGSCTSQDGGMTFGLMPRSYVFRFDTDETTTDAVLCAEHSSEGWTRSAWPYPVLAN